MPPAVAERGRLWTPVTRTTAGPAGTSTPTAGPATAAPTTSGCTPILVANWLLRPAAAITATFHDIDEASEWFRYQRERAAPGFVNPREREPARLAAKLTHAAWYIQATGYTTLDLIVCSPDRNNPGLVCPTAGRITV